MHFFTSECSNNSSAETAKEQKEDERSSSPLTHLFVELTSLEELSFPTSSSTRIKVWTFGTECLMKSYSALFPVSSVLFNID